MLFLGKKVINNVLLVLIIIVILIVASYLIYTHIINLQEQEEITLTRVEFLAQIEEGNLKDSSALWPSVYTHGKDDKEFLSGFSESLKTEYYKFYKARYLEGKPTDELYEIARLYFDFISKDNFTLIVNLVFDDYYNERITYVEYASATHDFYAISRRTSIYVAELLCKASDIHDSRNTFLQAETAASEADYDSAITLMRMVIPQDTLYYPKAIEKIDEYIRNLRDMVKNGN